MTERRETTIADLGLERAKRDGAGFLCCPTCGPGAEPEAGTDWAAVCRFNGDKPFLAALVCVECATEVVIEFGEPVEVKPA